MHDEVMRHQDGECRGVQSRQCLRPLLVISHQAAETRDPGPIALHDLPPRRQQQAPLGRRQLANLQAGAVPLRRRGFVARVTLVHEGHLERIAGDFLDLGRQLFDLSPILLVGRCHEGGQQLMERMHCQARFRAPLLFVPIIACLLTALRAGLPGVDSEDGRRRLRFAAGDFAQQRAQIMYDVREDSAVSQR